MTQNEWSETQTGASSLSHASEDFVRQEKRAAEELVDDAKAAASDAGSQAKKLAAEKAEELQRAAASHLRKFADAVRTAGDELADKEPGPVSDLVRQAAEGLERFSGALGRKASAEMIDGFRDFGRQNPVGFLAGSMLAGFALARFAGSGAPQTKTGSASFGERSDQGPAEAFGSAPRSGYEVDGDRQETLSEESFEGTYGQSGGDAPANAGADAAFGRDSSGEEPIDAEVESKWRAEV